MKTTGYLASDSKGQGEDILSGSVSFSFTIVISRGVNCSANRSPNEIHNGLQPKKGKIYHLDYSPGSLLWKSICTFTTGTVINGTPLNAKIPDWLYEKGTSGYISNKN